ncbi:uncharacterized protein LOC133202930 [Saccostrea echinata]|uniref:uncharacterized protein LOC133202930 n=1 Tax=Saccostrea echinata TaxID=191078 RepID=UPI002A81D54E|nr:uncharacterized protein LOC133202930 [Saccostrea echinata]
MTNCKVYSLSEKACTSKKYRKKAGTKIAVILLFMMVFGVCSCLLVIYIKMMDEVQHVMEKVNNLSRILSSSKIFNWNITSIDQKSVIDLERMQDKIAGNRRNFLTNGLELFNDANSGVTAVHYVPHEYHDIYQKQGITCKGTCCFVWSGTFCANQTFMINDPLHGVKFFKPSPWMKSQHIEEVEPLSQSQADTSSFTVTKSGLHLLYLNVLIQATKSSHDIAIYIDSSRKLDCRESLDYVRSIPSNPFMYSKGKTCSVSGVFFIQQGSQLSIRFLTANTAVILKPENTNFGAILLKT